MKIKICNPDNIKYVQQFNLRLLKMQKLLSSQRVLKRKFELDDEDKDWILEALGLTESGVDKLTRVAYHLLGLGTYFTAGEKEVRYLDFQAGIKGSSSGWNYPLRLWTWIHSCGDDVLWWAQQIMALKKQSKRQVVYVKKKEEYIVQDGDIMEFRFNVYL